MYTPLHVCLVIATMFNFIKKNTNPNFILPTDAKKKRKKGKVLLRSFHLDGGTSDFRTKTGNEKRLTAVLFYL